MKTLTALFLSLATASSGAAANDVTERDIHAELAVLDARIFGDGFNDCQLENIRELVAENLEFYHDVGGVLVGRDAFIDSLETNICASPFQPRRELVEGSLEVFPLYSNGELYGALQRGLHRFYERQSEHPDRATGTARFSTLWLLEDGDWIMTRVISFDHRPAD